MTISGDRCALGKLCRSSDDGIAGLANAGMCQPCQDWSRRIVGALLWDWLKLKVTIGESRAPARAGAKKPKPGPRIPINVNADALMDEIADALDDCATLVAAELNVTRKPLPEWRQLSPTQTYRRMRKSVALVQPNVEKLAKLAAGPDALQRVVMLHREVVRHMGETHQRERLHLPCPMCNHKALVREVQDLRGRQYVDGNETPEVVRCTSCNRTWTETEYRWLSTVVLAEREEYEMLRWLLAEARWERDCALWIAAEREWIITQIAKTIGVAPSMLLVRS